MQLIRTLAAWRPDVTGYREVAIAYRIALKSLARRYLELHDEIADLDVMTADIVRELAHDLISRNAVGYESAAQFLITDRQSVRSGNGVLVRVDPGGRRFIQKYKI